MGPRSGAHSEPYQTTREKLRTDLVFGVSSRIDK
jgi:hypothetical protein